MRNVCLLLTNCDGFPWNVRMPAMDAFEASGYPFSEFRWLSVREIGEISNVVADCKNTADNLTVLVHGLPIASVKASVLSGFDCEETPNSVGGEGVFTVGEKSLFLMDSKDSVFAKEVCIPFLHKKYGVRIGDIVLRCVGVDEYRMQEILQKGENYAQGRVKIVRSNRYGEDVIRIFYDENTPRMLTDDLLRYFTDSLRDNLYAMDDTPLEQQLVELLRLRRRKIAVAESFTGGAVANSIVQIPGASEVFYEGIVCYDTNSKIRRLGVNPLTVKAHTVVSREVALEMVQGLLEDGNCDIAIATTGYASPTGDPSRPAGLCYIAVANEQKAEIIRCNFSGTREQIIESGKRTALFSLNRILRG